MDNFDDNMKLLFSHPTGNANVRAAVTALHKENLIAEFHTTIASFEDSFLNRLSNIKLLSEIKRREFDNTLKNVTCLTPFKEACRLLSLKGGLHSFVRHENGWCSIDAVQHSLDKKVARRLYKRRNEIGGVYAYEDGAFFSFLKAKEIGLACLYDLPAAYWKTVRELMEREKERWPYWINTMNNFADSAEKLERKDKEISLADCIFVASSFTANSLKKYNGKIKKIKVIPYGFPPVNIRKQNASFIHDRPLKVLYVGKLSQQKGIANLFSAVDYFKKRIELTIVGSKVNNLPCEALNTELRKHAWVHSLPHDEILEMMRAHDVLVFPSISDGFGLVISEAMSQGTPVIASENTGGPDIIAHGYNGWLCEAGSVYSLQETFENLLTNTSSIMKAGNAAIESARQRPWTKYGEELAEAVRNYIN